MAVSVHSLSALILLGVWFFAPGTLAADQVFKKRSADGTVEFSDAPLNTQGQRVTYSTDFGRAPATASCHGQTPASLRQRRHALEAQFTEAAYVSGLELALLHAVAQVESCFDPKALSVAGAQGVMQLMPGTAKELGVANAYNARSNIIGGATYLKRMLERHQGDIKLALASYNAGPGAVSKHGGIPPYPETIRYVERVMKQLSENQNNGDAN